jgi:hypothetical protein
MSALIKIFVTLILQNFCYLLENINRVENDFSAKFTGFLTKKEKFLEINPFKKIISL